MGPTFVVEYGSLLRASALAFQPQWGLSGGVILYALAEWLTANYRGFPRKNLNLLGDIREKHHGNKPFGFGLLTFQSTGHRSCVPLREAAILRKLALASAWK